jgi:hypothetical protein
MNLQKPSLSQWEEVQKVRDEAMKISRDMQQKR